MKLLNTIQKIIQEAEEQYNNACESCVTVEELDRLEKHYKDSLKLLKLYQSEVKKNPNLKD
jgi:DNA invertase Pin-like site-specific DNA recombinase